MFEYNGTSINRQMLRLKVSSTHMLARLPKMMKFPVVELHILVKWRSEPSYPAPKQSLTVTAVFACTSPVQKCSGNMMSPIPRSSFARGEKIQLDLNQSTFIHVTVMWAQGWSVPEVKQLHTHTLL